MVNAADRTDGAVPNIVCGEPRRDAFADEPTARGLALSAVGASSLAGALGRRLDFFYGSAEIGLDIADRRLGTTFVVLDFAFHFQSWVADNFPGCFFDSACGLLYTAFDLVFVHDDSNVV